MIRTLILNATLRHNHHWSSWRSRNGDDDRRYHHHPHHHHHHVVDGCSSSSHSVVRTLMDGDEAFFILFLKLYELNTDKFIRTIQHLKCYSLLVIVATTLRKSIPRLLNEGTTTMTTRCAPACSQALPVKPQGVWARGIEAWARSRDLRNWSCGGGGLRGPPA